MLQLTCHNSEIDWRTREVKMMSCSEEYGKLKQRKSGQQKQKKKKKEENKKKKPKKGFVSKKKKKYPLSREKRREV